MNVHAYKRHPLISQLMTIRLALGLQQADVAEAGGLRRSTVGALESGKRNPSLDIFSRYCAGLGYRIDLAPLDSASSELPAVVGVYTVKEVAQILRTSEGTIFGLVKEGKIGSIKNGRFRRFTQEHIEQYLASREEVAK